MEDDLVDVTGKEQIFPTQAEIAEAARKAVLDIYVDILAKLRSALEETKKEISKHIDIKLNEFRSNLKILTTEADREMIVNKVESFAANTESELNDIKDGMRLMWLEIFRTNKDKQSPHNSIGSGIPMDNTVDFDVSFKNNFGFHMSGDA
jgi:hypothetical protein